MAKTAEQWAEEKGTDAWKLNAARTKYHWGVGREMTAEDFDNAIADVEGFSISDPKPFAIPPKPNQ